jgi:iron complex outermembrane receptor protein
MKRGRVSLASLWEDKQYLDLPLFAMLQRNLIKIVLLVICSFTYTPSIWAQRSSPDSATLLNAVEVRVFEQTRKLYEVPAAVVAITPAQLNRFGNNSLVPALSVQPGIRMEERSPGSYRINIRGSSLRAPFGVRNVKVYYNDIPYTTPGGDSYFNQLGFYGINNLTIIKGPGSSLYGAGTGGVILLQSEPAVRKEGLTAAVNGGSYGASNYYLSLRAGKEGFYNTFSYQDQRSAGYRDQSSLKRKVLRWDLTARPSEKSELSAHFLYSDLFYQTPGALNRKEFDSIPRSARPKVGALPGAIAAQAAISQKTFFSGIRYRYQLGPHWTEITSLYGAFTRLRNPGIFNFSWVNEAHTGGRSAFHYQKEKISVSLGAELQQGYTSAKTFRNLNGAPDTLRTDDEVNTLSLLLFAQATVSLGKNWSLTGGLSINQLNIALTRLSVVPTSIAKRNYSNEWMPRVALLKEWTSHHSLYASLSRGFSPPTTSEVLPSSGILATTLEAEDGLSLEVGARGDFKNNRLSYDVNVFHYNLKNAIVIRRDALGRDYFVNAGSTRQMGLEGQGSYWFDEGKRETLNPSRLWMSYTLYSFDYQDYQRGTTDYSGKRLPSVPQNNLCLGMDLFFKRGLYTHLIYTYTDRIPLNDANTDWSSAANLLSARLGFKKKMAKNKTIDLFIAGDNLTDTRYCLGFDLNAAAGRYFNTAPGRNVNLGVQLTLD